MAPVGGKHGTKGPKSILQPLSKDFRPTQLTSSSAVVLVRTSKDIPDKKSQVCMVTKTKRVDFGGSTVFPGGLTSYDADGRFVHSYLRSTNNISQIKKHNFNYDEILRRINALRELFEETGILLGQSLIKQTNDDINNNKNILIPKYATYPHKAHIINKIAENGNEDSSNSSNSSSDRKVDWDDWREKIIASPFEFENMYNILGMLPDITALVPWARFQTPYSQGRRWDTHFYLALIDDNEVLKLDTNCFFARGHEISNVHWLTCQEMLHYHSLTLNGNPNNEKIFYRFPPPTLKMVDELNSIVNEDNLYDEWKYRFINRKMTAYLPRLIVINQENTNMKTAVIGPRDYLYYIAEAGKTVELNEKYEKEGLHLQRVYLNKNGTCQLANSFQRLYAYGDDDGETDNGQMSAFGVNIDNITSKL